MYAAFSLIHNKRYPPFSYSHKTKEKDGKDMSEEDNEEYIYFING